VYKLITGVTVELRRPELDYPVTIVARCCVDDNTAISCHSEPISKQLLVRRMAGWVTAVEAYLTTAD